MELALVYMMGVTNCQISHSSQTLMLSRPSNALLSEVFIDDISGAFDSQPDLTEGCNDTSQCYAFTPFGFSAASNTLLLGYALNNVVANGNDRARSNFTGGTGTDLTSRSNSMYAVWTPIDPVPPQADTTPPELIDFTVSPLMVDTSTGSASVSVRVEARDDLSGFDNGGNGSIDVRHTSGSNYVGSGLPITGGTNLEPVFEITLTVPQFSQSGFYPITLHLSDNMGNVVFFSSADLAARGFPSQIEVTEVQDNTLYILTDTILTEDHTGNIVIDADNVILDCDGHAVISPTPRSGIGIYLYGRTAVIVKNCNITGFNDGISLDNSKNNSIKDNDISDNLNGIYLRQSNSNNVIKRNNIFDNHDEGIKVGASSNDNTISKNTVSGNIGTAIQIESF